MSDKIPKHFQRTVKLLAEWTDGQYGILHGFLRQHDPVISLHGLIDKVQSSLPELPADDIDEILHGCFAMCSFQAYMNYSIPELVDETFSTQSLIQLGIGTDRIDSARERISAIVGLPVVSVSAKAREVLEAHGRVYKEARIFTDIRPVYPSTAAEVDKPDAAVIIHTLRIRHHINGHEEEFYLALDEIDVGLLQDVLLRAEQKALGLKTLLKSGGVFLLGE